MRSSSGTLLVGLADVRESFDRICFDLTKDATCLLKSGSSELLPSSGRVKVMKSEEGDADQLTG